jgi:hypothetical protein
MCPFWKFPCLKNDLLLIQINLILLNIINWESSLFVMLQINNTKLNISHKNVLFIKQKNEK